MERDPQNQNLESSTIMSMRTSERRMMFDRAFNDLLALREEKNTSGMDQSRSSFEAREEEVLIGTVLRFRRLGVTPPGYHFTFQESEDRERFGVTIRRGEAHVLSYDIEIERLRPPQLQTLLNATMKSYRNKR